MKLHKWILFLSIVPLFAFSTHKYYLSMTQIEYNEKQQSLQIITNVFMDDIELALNEDYNIDLQLTTEKELKNSDEYFEKYFKKKLQFKREDSNLPFNYLGKEYDGDLVYVYLEIENVKTPMPLEVSNEILIEYFEDQKNVVKIKVGKKRRSKILTKENDKALLKF